MKFEINPGQFENSDLFRYRHVYIRIPLRLCRIHHEILSKVVKNNKRETEIKNENQGNSNLKKRHLLNSFMMEFPIV